MPIRCLHLRPKLYRATRTVSDTCTYHVMFRTSEREFRILMAPKKKGTPFELPERRKRSLKSRQKDGKYIYVYILGWVGLYFITCFPPTHTLTAVINILLRKSLATATPLGAKQYPPGATLLAVRTNTDMPYDKRVLLYENRDTCTHADNTALGTTYSPEQQADMATIRPLEVVEPSMDVGGGASNVDAPGPYF